MILHDIFNIYYQLSFSPDGTKFMLAFSNQAILYKVPFNIMYPKNTTKKLHYFLFYLNSYKHEHEPLPKEIIHIITRNALEAHKRTTQRKCHEI